ncbi:MAG: DUF424 family protein [Candidatus Pacearchaeota archaeon]|jgi:hypothetical protein
MFVNIIHSYRYVVAICDKELIGQKFETEKFQLDVKENFYKGNEMTKSEAIEIMKKMSLEDATFNIVGKKSVQAAIEAKIINPEGVLEIAGIPYAMVLL